MPEPCKKVCTHVLCKNYQKSSQGAVLLIVHIFKVAETGCYLYLHVYILEIHSNVMLVLNIEAALHDFTCFIFSVSSSKSLNKIAQNLYFLHYQSGVLSV